MINHLSIQQQPLAAQIKSKFSSSTSYALDKINLSLFSQLFELSTGAAFMLAGAYPFMWRAAAEAGGRAFGWNEREVSSCDEGKSSHVGWRNAM